MLQTCLPPSQTYPMADQAKALWCAVQTYGRCEQAVASLLESRGVECFLPLERVRVVRRGRAETVSRAFYPDYLFASYSDENERHEIRRTRYVADLIAPHGHREQRLANEIDSLRRVLEIEPIADSTPWANEAGRRVLVIGGPFMGIEGHIVRRHRKVAGLTVSKDLLCVGVLMLGRVVEVEIDPCMCEPL